MVPLWIYSVAIICTALWIFFFFFFPFFVFKHSFFSFNTMLELYHPVFKDNSFVVQDEKLSLNKQFKNVLHSSLQWWQVLNSYVQTKDQVCSPVKSMLVWCYSSLDAHKNFPTLDTTSLPKDFNPGKEPIQS